MKKRIACLLLILCLFAAAAPAALAIDVSILDGTGIPLLPEMVSGEYVYDWGNILTRDQREALDKAAKEVSETCQCGVYIVTDQDYRTRGNSAREAAKSIYRDSGFGLGEGQDGILLYLSMSGRDYWIATYGYGTVAFTDYGLELLSEKFLDNFRRDDWDGGFSDYISQCGAMLKQAREGNPLDVNNRGIHGIIREIRQELGPLGLFLVVIIFPCAVALIVCRREKRKLKSVERAGDAEFFAVPNSLRLYASEDVFSHVTETRVLIESDSDRGGDGGGGGGSSIDSDGFGGSGGKF